MTTQRANGDGYLYKRKSDNMWIGAMSFRDEDGRLRRKTVSSRDRNKAATKFRELRSQIDAGELPITDAITVEKWLNHWVETIIKPKRAPMTYRSYEQTIRLHIVPHVGTKRLDKLTADDIRKAYTQIQNRSPRFALSAHQVLRRSLKQAKTDGKLHRNPMLGVESPSYTPKERKAFSFDVASHIVATAFNEYGDMAGTRWAAAFRMGSRRSSRRIYQAHMAIATLAERVGTTCRAEARQIAGTLWWTRPKKSDAGMRNIPIYELPPLVEALRRLKETDTNNPHGLVFHHPDGRPIVPEDHYDDWRALLKSADVPYIAPHAIRRTTTTLLRKAGVPQDVRMMITGHTSVQAHELYVQLEHQDAALALKNLAAIMPADAARQS